ncbi:MAG: hypothetical protein M3Q09_03635 [Gemmatimonadota bacterium]|nr:hypothetical protein [Gemmatimonadota bacterium]
MSTSEILKYFGKSYGEDNAVVGHPVVYHSLDVAAVADEILERRPLALSRFAELLGIETAIARGFLVTLVSLHDLGKFAPPFHAKVPVLWPESIGPFPGALPPRARGDDPFVGQVDERLYQSSPRTRG